MSILVLLFIPLAAAILSLLPLRRFTAIPTIISSIIVLAITIHLAGYIVNTAHILTVSQWISIDGLSVLMLLLISFISTMAAFFSWNYISLNSYTPKKLHIYYANYNLFVFSMLAIPVISNPILVWIFVELTTLFSVLLVSFEDTRKALEAAWKYVMLSLMGAVIALLGFMILFAAMHEAGGITYTWNGLISVAARMPYILSKTAFILILIGLGTKVGLVPMHTWLPDAHSQAPSPVCALLSGIETTVILYVILRIFSVFNIISSSYFAIWAIIFGLISVGVSVFLLLQVTDYKRMFAFSTIEHMGIILLAIGIGTSAGYYGALYQILSHALTKSFCFFAAGATLMVVGTNEIASIRGLIHKSPVAGVSLLIGGLAIAGAPPFVVFLSEFSIFKAGLARGDYVLMGLLGLFIVIGFFGILQHINHMVFGKSKEDNKPTVHLPMGYLIALGISGLLVITLGFYMPEPLHQLMKLGVESLKR